MNMKILVLVICVEVIIYLLLCNLCNCTFKTDNLTSFLSDHSSVFMSVGNSKQLFKGSDFYKFNSFLLLDRKFMGQTKIYTMG